MSRVVPADTRQVAHASEKPPPLGGGVSPRHTPPRKLYRLLPQTRIVLLPMRWDVLPEVFRKLALQGALQPEGVY
jgi:hypothetical protein